jgi:FKBP-type peptidyl-prolyl cis-trans isomerase FkpA
MQPIQTGIVVALAVAIVALFFGLLPLSGPATESITNAQNASTTMPTDTATDTQLIMNDEIISTGATATSGDSVTVNYVGTLTDGTVFDASANHATTGFTFTLGVGQVIPGWDQGIVGMREGGKRKLVIPSSLAYGPQGQGSIPPNATLIFEVELLKVQKAQ